MDSRKESISAMKICRFCLTQNEPLSSLYDRIKAPKDPVPLSLKILSCVGMEIYPSSRTPQYICHQCKFFMDMSFGFKQICRQADENILQFIQHGKAIGPISWPASLKKVFKSSNKGVTGDVGMVETVTTQSGATVQVMAEEVSDDEDEGDDDNVYNVKVADGPEEGKRIKIVTTDKPEAKKRNRKDSEDESFEHHPIKREGSVCWPCDECDCTYPLEQLLALHKAQKHRERLVNCDVCDAKFFTKYDLATHQLIHESELSFHCSTCGIKFKKHQLLKRHEKLIHTDIPQKECNRCPAKFLCAEELEAHQQRHVINMEQPYWCKLCDKRFHEKSILVKHQEFVHKKKPEFSCQYCPEQFSTVSKLTRHLKAHAGERPYPCKHCNKSFIKSHHYTRHLRVKHSDLRNQSGGGEDAYRCEECVETFSTQDELMYHSALHATQNLVCPLCQEKFDDVDTVTAHIKSHVNGNEFMCDFCELIFTSKEKLENHVASAHDDELLANDQDEQDESSMDMDAEEDDDYNSINVKEEDGHMVVEINKAEQFMLRPQDDEEKNDNTQSEDSEMEVPYEPPAPKPTVVKTPNKQVATPDIKPDPQVLLQKLPLPTSVAKPADSSEKAAPSILKKAEEIKRQVIEQQSSATLDKSEKKSNYNNKVESSSTASGASEKSLRLLEKELQDLKRTNTRNEATKTPAKPLESLRKRPVIHTSTPKTRTAEKREVQQTKPLEKQVVPEKKSERRSVTKDTKDSATKETKEIKDSKDSKETKEAKGNSVREEKFDKDNTKEESAKVKKDDVKEKEKEKAVVKNGVNEKPQEEGVRRSTRPSKVKDYAKMIRANRSSSEEDSDEESYEDDSKETDKSSEATQPRGRGRKSISKTPATPTPAPSKTATTPATTPASTPASAPKKRGRPRKIQNQEPTPAKIRKEESPENAEKPETAEVEKPKIEAETKRENETIAEEKNEESESPKPTENNFVMVSPSGQTLKKVPIKALPPGVKPLPLPRSMGAGEVCEMQIGKKVVKVQKIVMTKAEVEEMAKKGLVEMKDGTMVLKQGIKLPSADPTSIKSTIMGEGEKKLESPKKE